MFGLVKRAIDADDVTASIDDGARHLSAWLGATTEFIEQHGATRLASSSSAARIESVRAFATTVVDALSACIAYSPTHCSALCVCIAALCDASALCASALAARPLRALLECCAATAAQAAASSTTSTQHCDMLERASVNAAVALTLLVGGARRGPAAQALLVAATLPSSSSSTSSSSSVDLLNRDGAVNIDAVDGGNEASSWSLVAQLIGVLTQGSALREQARRALVVVELLDALSLLCETHAAQRIVVGAMFDEQRLSALANVKRDN